MEDVIEDNELDFDFDFSHHNALNIIPEPPKDEEYLGVSEINPVQLKSLIVSNLVAEHGDVEFKIPFANKRYYVNLNIITLVNLIAIFGKQKVYKCQNEEKTYLDYSTAYDFITNWEG